MIREGLSALGFTVYAGVNAPYIWLKTPEGMGSWDFFDALLDYRHGLRQYRRDEKWRRDTIQHFRHNLCRMVHLARDAGVPLVCNQVQYSLFDRRPARASGRAAR